MGRYAVFQSQGMSLSISTWNADFNSVKRCESRIVAVLRIIQFANFITWQTHTKKKSVCNIIDNFIYLFNLQQKHNKIECAFKQLMYYTIIQPRALSSSKLWIDDRQRPLRN